MRKPPVPPADMGPRLRALHDDMAAVVAKHLEGSAMSVPGREEGLPSDERS